MTAVPLVAPAAAPGAPKGLLAHAFAALDAAGVPWAVLRGVEELAHPQGDVDLLIHPGAADRAAEILEGCGYRRLPARGHGTHQFYVAYDAEQAVWVELDTVGDAAFGANHQFRTAAAPALLARRVRRGGVAALLPGDEFWHRLLHQLLGRPALSERARGAIGGLAADADPQSPLARAVDAVRPGLASDLLTAVRAGVWSRVWQLGLTLRRAWRRTHRVDVAAASARNRVARRVPSLRGGGLSLAILGPDGAGKTTLAEGLLAELPLPSRYVYLGIWRQTRLDAQLARVPGTRLATRLLLLLAKSALITYDRRVGRVVVLDRYTCDADLPSDDLDLKGRISAELVRRTCAEPDLMILLDGPVELMFARKGEHGLRELQIRRDAYHGMFDRFPQMVAVDAAQPRELVRRDVTAVLWARLARASAAP